MKLSPPSDLANMTQAADFWQTSLNEQEAWEVMRLECKAEQEARKEVKP
jgi:hypothetical protein